jgi:uncharacterized iron-regulated protein
MHDNGIRVLVLTFVALIAAATDFAVAATVCVPVGAWVAPANPPKPVASAELVSRLARAKVVLLGEIHDNPDHHRWQLQTLAALHALRPDMKLAFEMFPRRVQPVLDRWVAGELSESEFLRAVDWRHIWSVDPQLYLPIFQFARMNRVPMVAMNVDRKLVKAVDEKGFDAVPPEAREGVTRPAAPSDAYLDFLLSAYRAHEHVAGKETSRDDPAFRRFVESQQLWDRAMAQAIAASARVDSPPLVVGILGGGHVTGGYGVPHQLRDLGVTDTAWLMPWDQGEDCARLTAGYAQAVFGIAARSETAEERSQRPRLGVFIDTGGEGVRIKQVEKGSIAQAAGIIDGDYISEAAGVALKEFADLRAVIERQAPGTWLPLKIRRGGETLDVVARFPPDKR